jgi:hypothetical protein
MCPPAPPAKRIARFQPAASANIRSTLAAQAGKAQISGAHAADAIGRRSRYPQVGWLLAPLAAEVVSSEIWPDLAAQARRNLADHGIINVLVVAGDGI